MTLEDPFYVVKDEVFKALNKTRGLFLRWQEISASLAAPPCPDAEWTSTELKNALRSIQWDLEDLEDTISIVEKYPSKFKLDNKEISERRRFIDNIKSEVKMMKGRMSMNRGVDTYGSPRETMRPLLADDSPGEGEGEEGADPQGHSSPLNTRWNKTYTRWSGVNTSGFSPNDSLRHEDEDSGGEARGSPRSAQLRMLGLQDGQLESIARTANNLNSVSRNIGRELDDHVLMLEDINSEMENVESKLESSMRQVARVLRVNNSRRQWIVIGCLTGLVFLVLILFIVL